jgi:hypothetical protein
MRRKLLFCTTLILSVFAYSAKAQSDIDTSNYDLGRILLQKKYTQAVTIKAVDLEKIPFTSLSDVISLYFNGFYGARQQYTFVIDGNLNTDVNAYSIYDIDEITFIQNAATVLNGGDASKTLVLVKTKRAGEEHSGITVAGQTNIVRQYDSYQPLTTSTQANSGNSTTNLYHQYYVSGYINSNGISAGASADIQHNVFPEFHNVDKIGAITPLNTNRFKFNGYLDMQLDEHNLLSVNTGYVPQRDNAARYQNPLPVLGHGFTGGADDYSSQNLFYADIKLNSTIATGFTNKLSAGFQRLRLDAHRREHGEDNGVLADVHLTDTVGAINSYLVIDNVNYQTQIGDFTLQPNVNFTYREARNQGTYSTNDYFSNGVHGTYAVPHIASQRLAILTPSLSINYLDIAMVQGGFQTLVNSNQKVLVTGHDYNAPLPFASVSVDVLKPFDVDSSDARLMLFGSYAKNFISNDLTGSLLDFNFIRAGDGLVYSGTPPDPYQTYIQIQGGLTLGLLDNALSFSYNYNVKRYNTLQVTVLTDPLLIDSFSVANARIDMHRLGIDFNLPTDGDFKWHTNLNGNLLILRGNKGVNYVPDQFHLFYPDKSYITGGFANHFAYKDLFLDVSLIYDLNQAKLGHIMYLRSYQVTGKLNALDIQNINIGYRIPTTRFKSVEVFANARNLFNSGEPKAAANEFVFDDRRFYGAGFKIGL